MAGSSRRDRIAKLYEGVRNRPRARTPPAQLTMADIVSSDMTRTQKRKAKEYYEQGHCVISSKDMLESFENLLERGITRSMWVDFHTLRRLGVFNDFMAISNRLGIPREFWEMQEETYLELTLEFLSSLDLTEDDGEHIITYQLGNVPHKFDLGILAHYFDLPDPVKVDSIKFRYPYDRALFYSKFTGGPGPYRHYGAHSNEFKISKVQHPSIRILLQIWISTIFARGESESRANKEELVLLKEALLPDDEFSGPNIAQYIANHWLKLKFEKDYPAGVGMYVTYLAKIHDIDVTQYTRVTSPENNVINTEYLMKRGHIKERNDRFFLVQKSGLPHTPLPYPNNIRFGIEESWKLQDVVQQAPEPHNSPAQSPHHSPDYQARQQHPEPENIPSYNPYQQYFEDQAEYHNSVLNSLQAVQNQMQGMISNRYLISGDLQNILYHARGREEEIQERESQLREMEDRFRDMRFDEYQRFQGGRGGGDPGAGGSGWA